MESGQHYVVHYRHNPYAFAVPSGSTVVASGSGDQRERFPQWSQSETREFLALRWNLDQSFVEMKRNKLLWELISNKMKEKGFCRTPDQCKCKWKNLVTRYKGGESSRQFPFQEDMQRIFSDRMQRFLDSDQGNNGVQPTLGVLSEEEEEEEEENDALTMIEEERKEPKQTKEKKRKMAMRSSGEGTASTDRNNDRQGQKQHSMKNALRDFMKGQIQKDEEWMKISEAREVERRGMEMKWRTSMEALAAERADIDRKWREKEEERRCREEERAERRHELLVALLNKLTNMHP